MAFGTGERMSQLVTVQEAAAMFGVHHNTIRKLIRDKRINDYRMGYRILRVNPDEIVEAMKNHEND